MTAGVATATPRDDARVALDRAVATFRNGDIRAARGQVAAAVKADPSWPLAQALQGRITLALRDPVAAETELKRAIEKGYRSDDLRHLLAHAYVLEGRLAAALEEARADKVPPRYAAYAARVRSMAQLQGGNRAAAWGELQTAVRLDPRNSITWTDIGRMRLFGGDVAGALTAGQQAVALDPRNVDALVLSGTLIRDQYGLPASLPWFDRALAVEPGNMAAMLERAATLGDVGRTVDMLAQTRAILAVDPKNPQAYYLQAVMAARAKDWSLARSLLDRVGGRMGELAGPRYLAALVDLAQGNAEQAIAQLKVLLAAQPDNVQVRRLLGSALRSSGDDRGAIDVLRPLADRPDADSYTLTLIGRAEEKLGNRALAAQYLDRAAVPLRGAATPFDGSNMRPLDGGGVAIPYIRQLLASGRAGDATAEAQRIARDHPGAPAAMLIVGDTLYAQGRWREAADAYRRAANLRFSEETALRLIDALRRAGDDRAAYTVLDLYRAQNPQSVVAQLLASELMLSNGEWDAASALLDGLRHRIGDRDATLLNNLGWARLNQQRVAEAAELGRTAYALAPGSAPVAASYGWFAASAGDRKTGIALLEKAVALAPDVPLYRARLAKVRAGG